MKASVETLGSWERKIVVEVPSKEVGEALESAYRSLSRNVRVKGFRAGKVPRGVLVRMYGDRVRNEVIQSLVDKTFGKALEQHTLQPVSEPVIEPERLEEGNSWRYTARLEVKPEVKAATWEGLKLTRTAAEVDDAAVRERLDRMAEMHSQLLTEDDSVCLARGHFAIIDFEGAVDGVAFEGGEGREVTIEVGAGRFFPGLEEQMEGMGRNETRNLSATFPDAYQREDLAGKTASFAVTLKEIKRKVVPAIDDEFAKDTGELKTLDELRAKVRDDLFEEREREATRDLREQARERIAVENPVDAPPALVEREFRSMIEGTRRRFATQGVEMEQLGLTPESLEKEWRPRAEKNVKAALILEQIAVDQGLSVTDDDFNRHFEPIARDSKQRISAVRAAYEQRGLIPMLRSRLMEEKGLDLVLEKANIRKEKQVRSPGSASGKKAGS